MHRIQALFFILALSVPSLSLAQENDPFYDLNAALGIAVTQGDLGYAERALQLGAYTEEKDSDGRTPLLLSASKGNLEMLRLLLSRNARVDAADNKGRTALHILSGEGVAGGDALAMLCVEARHPLNPLDAEGNTPLHLASATGNAAMIKLLLTAGAATDIKNHQKKTPKEVAKDASTKNLFELAKKAPALTPEIPTPSTK